MALLPPLPARRLSMHSDLTRTLQPFKGGGKGVDPRGADTFDPTAIKVSDPFDRPLFELLCKTRLKAYLNRKCHLQFRHRELAALRRRRRYHCTGANTDRNLDHHCSSFMAVPAPITTTSFRSTSRSQTTIGWSSTTRGAAAGLEPTPPKKLRGVRTSATCPLSLTNCGSGRSTLLRIHGVRCLRCCTRSKRLRMIQSAHHDAWCSWTRRHCRVDSGSHLKLSFNGDKTHRPSCARARS